MDGSMFTDCTVLGGTAGIVLAVPRDPEDEFPDWAERILSGLSEGHRRYVHLYLASEFAAEENDE